MEKNACSLSMTGMQPWYQCEQVIFLISSLSSLQHLMYYKEGFQWILKIFSVLFSGALIKTCKICCPKPQSYENDL